MRRTKASIINAFVGIVTIIIEILSHILLRKIFYNSLGKQVYGFNEFIKSSIGVLSLAELGIASVIGFSLYKPIAVNDKKEIVALMSFYKKIYQKVGFAILFFGILFSLFLTFWVSEYKSNLNFLYTSYFLALIGTFLTYFFSYSKTFLMVNEKSYIINIIRVFYLILGFVFLAIGIVQTKDYKLYIALWSIFQILENFTSYLFVKKKYPYIVSKKKYELSKESKTKIKKNIKALITHKIGGVLVLETDSIVATTICGLTISGFFANYVLIVWSAQKILNQIFDGIRASFGIFAHIKEKEETKKMFLILQMLGFILYTWASCFILNLCQPFMILWMGKSSKLSFFFVVLLTINFYLRGFRSALDLVKDIRGIYHQDRFKPIVEGTVNLIFSIVLVNLMGPEGIILGTIISFIGVLLVVEPRIVYKYAFEENPIFYYKEYLKYVFLFGVILASSFFVCNLINLESIIDEMIIKFFICVILPIVLFFIFLGGNSEFRFLFNFLKNFFKKKKILQM